MEKPGFTLTYHLPVFVLRRTLALPCPVQIETLTNEQITHLFDEDVHTTRVLQQPHLIHSLNQDKVSGVDCQRLSKDGVCRGLAPTQRRSVFNVIQPTQEDISLAEWRLG